MKRIFAIALAALCLMSCGGRQGSKGTDNTGAAGSAAKFPYPEVPAMMQKESEREEYAVTHFWNSYFAKLDQYGNDSVVEGAYANYVTMLNAVPVEVMLRAQDTLMALAERAQKAEPDAKLYERFLDLSSHYLDDPNSPYRNEEFYLPVLESILTSDIASPEAKSKAEYKKPMLSLNRLGTVANDFTYTLKNGRTGTLHAINTDRILLFFSNPGCQNCKEIIDMLSASDHVTRLIDEGKLTVLNVYPDSDLTEWYGYMSHYPNSWINGFDAENILNSDKIYYIKAIPSLYLLDSEKRVLAKDATPEHVMEMLQ